MNTQQQQLSALAPPLKKQRLYVPALRLLLLMFAAHKLACRVNWSHGFKASWLLLVISSSFVLGLLGSLIFRWTFGVCKHCAWVFRRNITLLRLAIQVEGNARCYVAAAAPRSHSVGNSQHKLSSVPEPLWEKGMVPLVECPAAAFSSGSSPLYSVAGLAEYGSTAPGFEDRTSKNHAIKTGYAS